MTGAWGLPMQAELGGVRYAIRSDYRDVLELLRWLNGQADPALDQSERWYVAMRLFYPEFAALPQRLWRADRLWLRLRCPADHRLPAQ